MSDSNSAEKKPPALHTVEKKNENHFVEHFGDGQRPLNWFRQWEYLTLDLTDIQIRFAESASQRASAKGDESDYLMLCDLDGINELWGTNSNTGESTDERRRLDEVYARLLNQTFQNPDYETSLLAEADFTITQNRSLEFIVSGEKPSYFGKRTGRITILSKAQPEAGAVWLVDSSEATYSDNPIEVGTVRLQVTLPLPQFERFVATLRSAPSGSICSASMSVLAFQSEMERSLAEFHHFQTLYFERPSGSAAVLHSVWVTTPKLLPHRPSETPDDANELNSNNASRSIGSRPNEWADQPQDRLEISDTLAPLLRDNSTLRAAIVPLWTIAAILAVIAVQMVARHL